MLICTDAQKLVIDGCWMISRPSWPIAIAVKNNKEMHP